VHLAVKTLSLVVYDSAREAGPSPSPVLVLKVSELRSDVLLVIHHLFVFVNVVFRSPFLVFLDSRSVID
jgi:hypothetical protein